MTVTQDDILQAIRDAMVKLPVSAGGPEGLTTAEFAEATGISITRARDELRRAIMAKLVVPVRLIRYSPLTNGNRSVPGFRPA